MPTRREVFQSLAAAAAAPAPAQSGKIRHIDLIHHSHTDVGYTDLPTVTRELQVRFLDSAIEACLLNPRFRWTCEVTMTIADFWRQAPPARRAQFVQLVQRGQMDVMALPFNQAPFMNARQWRRAMDWLPASLLKQLNPRVAMQNDVNGFPRAGALLCLDRGIRHLMMGINADMGGPPFRRPSAFHWKMPDGRKMFVWLGDHYGTAYAFFEPNRWQHGQAKGATTTLRPPYAGDHLKTDESSLRASQAHLAKRLAKLEAEGYSYDRLILSYTNQWRYDNDPPFPPLAAFVDAWNNLGLTPTLRLVTATQAVFDMEKAVASLIPTYEGEWTDWWANGDASGPREVAASRLAKRHIEAALSPVWGPSNARIDARVEEMLRDLCLFDEHTWGANVSVSQPDSLDTIGQYTEKSLTAYRPMGHAEWLLGQRARTHFAGKPEATYVVNTAPAAYTGWVKMPGIDKPSVWVEKLPARMAAKLGEAPKPRPNEPSVELGPGGWPMAAVWPGMAKPLFTNGLGDLLSVWIAPPARRSSRMTPENLKRTAATYGTTKRTDGPYTILYSQPVEHSSLNWGERRVELFRGEPRATLTVRLDRKSQNSAEAFFVLCGFPVAGVLPEFTNGGVKFVPFDDQLPGACRDYVVVDGWGRYTTTDGQWLWVTRDAPLVAVGGPHTWQRITSKPPDTERLWTLVFDNFWHTNFVANSNGLMEFQWELAWAPKFDDPAAVAETLVSEPLVVLQPGVKESPELMKSLFTP